MIGALRLDLLDETRRRIVRLTAWGIASICTILAVPTIGVMVWFQLWGLIGYLGVIVAAIAGAVGSLALERRAHPLMVMPIAATIAVLECVAALLFPNLALIAIPFLSIVALLVEIGGGRQLARITGIAMFVLAIGLTAGAPLPTTGEGLVLPPFIVRLIGVASNGTLLLLLWIIGRTILIGFGQTMTLAIEQAAQAREQRDAAAASAALIMSLEIPTIAVAHNVILSPIQGVVTSERLDRLTERVLTTVAADQIHTVIVDLTGMESIDTRVAQQLSQLIAAIHLMGATVIVSGIAVTTATILVGLGLRFDARTVATVAAALDLLNGTDDPLFRTATPAVAPRPTRSL